MKTISLISIFSFQLCFGAVTEMREASAVRLQNDIIRIDGKLTELIWQSSLIRSDFLQRNPLEGESATEKTAFSIAYDDNYLYVGIMAFTEDISTIRKILSRRDEETPSDWLFVSIDSYNDNRTAFEFGLNPSGVKRDLRRFDDDNYDDNWDAIWEGKSSVNHDSWSAEFKIPLRELRFDEGNEQTWGLQINRYIAKNNEDDYWTYWSKDESGWVRHYGDLVGLTNIPKQDRLQISPYVTSSYDHYEGYINPTHPDEFDKHSNVGADIKYGVTNNLTLDVSLNPDFGQVEADPAELNISGFESYFGERRPFFMEGGNIFNFNLGFGDGDQSMNTLFYTRR
ncbi:MAG: carbohydrate binding family 9 domain-containing protein, partial [Candidatus Marinimicrobia bacterium]|nr:carbohydrate binding family 9 domain-containing protein [Candidatus Neomarinimicrobiota bacterium]